MWERLLGGARMGSGGSSGEVPAEASAGGVLGLSDQRDMGDAKGKDLRCEGKGQGMSKRAGTWSLVSRTKGGAFNRKREAGQKMSRLSHADELNFQGQS